MIFKFLINSSKKLILSFCLISSLHAQTWSTKGLPEEYYDIKDVNEAKEYFLSHIYKLVQEENKLILQEQEFVKNYLSSNILNINFSSPSFHKLLEIKRKYKIKSLYSYEEYQKKIDIIPPSLALAQAAIESGWGKSRFVKEANNIFGHWTYDPKFGMIPKQRKLGASHFIRVFQTLEDSISAYMLNLNRNFAYKSFQEKRFEQRKRNQTPDGLSLSDTMLNYSGIAQEYLKILKDIILSNELQNFDRKFYNLNY